MNKAKKNISCKIKMLYQSCPLLVNANGTPQNNTKNREDIQFGNLSNFLIPTQISTSNSLVLLQFKSLQLQIKLSITFGVLLENNKNISRTNNTNELRGIRVPNL